VDILFRIWNNLRFDQAEVTDEQRRLEIRLGTSSAEDSTLAFRDPITQIGRTAAEGLRPQADPELEAAQFEEKKPTILRFSAIAYHRSGHLTQSPVHDLEVQCSAVQTSLLIREPLAPERDLQRCSSHDRHTTTVFCPNLSPEDAVLDFGEQW
jgi:hypothetical protein